MTKETSRISVQNKEHALLNKQAGEFVSLTEFKPLEFERFKIEAGSNYFLLSPQKWIEPTNAEGIILD